MSVQWGAALSGVRRLVGRRVGVVRAVNGLVRREMTRLQSLLKGFEEGRGVELLNRDEVSLRRVKVIAQMQARYDHLAGCPKRGDDEAR